MITEILSYANSYGMLPSSGVVLACVSGGADSKALLTVLTELSKQHGFTVEAAHFDHRLRGDESDRDREFVKSYCEAANIPCHIGSGDTRDYAEKNGLGIEESARELRYSFFREMANKIGASRIATAHNADDNAETVLLCLARGAGSKGLSGIPPVRGEIIRPLLCVTRDEIEAFLHERGISYVTDSTNSSDEYARNRIRNHVSPVLRSVNASFTRHALEAGELLRQDDEFLTSLARDFVSKHDRRVPAAMLLSLPDAVSSRVIMILAGGSLPFLHVRRVLDLCRSESGTKLLETPRGSFLREYETLYFNDSYRENSFSAVEIVPGENVNIPELGFEIRCRTVACDEITVTDYEKRLRNVDTVNKSFNILLFKKAQICGKIIVRPRAEGDLISIFRRGVTKSLKKLYIENKIPKGERGLVPVLADDSGPLAVIGICVSDRALPEPDAPAIEISFVRVLDG